MNTEGDIHANAAWNRRFTAERLRSLSIIEGSIVTDEPEILVVCTRRR